MKKKLLNGCRILFTISFILLIFLLTGCQTPGKGGPETAIDWYNRGVFLVDKNNQEAIEAFQKSVELDPNNADSWKAMGWCLNEIGKHSEAVSAYDQALQINPDDPELWHRKGLVFARAGNYDEAVAAYTKALDLYPHDPNWWLDKGDALTMLGRIAEAQECYQEAEQQGFDKRLDKPLLE